MSSIRPDRQEPASENKKQPGGFLWTTSPLNPMAAAYKKSGLDEWRHTWIQQRCSRTGWDIRWDGSFRGPGAGVRKRFPGERCPGHVTGRRRPVTVSEWTTWRSTDRLSCRLHWPQVDSWLHCVIVSRAPPSQIIRSPRRPRGRDTL